MIHWMVMIVGEQDRCIHYRFGDNWCKVASVRHTEHVVSYTSGSHSCSVGGISSCGLWGEPYSHVCILWLAFTLIIASPTCSSLVKIYSSRLGDRAGNMPQGGDDLMRHSLRRKAIDTCCNSY